MTSQQLVKFAEKCVKVWRKRFRLAAQWDIDIEYCKDPYEDDPRSMCVMDDERAEYWCMILRFYPPSLEYKADTTIKNKVNQIVCHELRHVFYWPMSSFAKNVLSDKLWTEYLKHEEQCVQMDEEIFTNQKPKRGEKLTWGT